MAFTPVVLNYGTTTSFGAAECGLCTGKMKVQNPCFAITAWSLVRDKVKKQLSATTPMPVVSVWVIPTSGDEHDGL